MDLNVAFVTNARAVVGWYRGALPALYSGADWFGVSGDDPRIVASQVTKRSWPDQCHEYDVVVWQQPLSPSHRAMIRELREAGVKVIIEVDDYLHGVAKMNDHDFRDRPEFGKKSMEDFERMMSVCDGLIVSTQYLHDKYARFNEKAFVCLNGLDLGRYEKTRTPHQTVNLGWAGATGHTNSFQRVAQAIHETLVDNPSTTFISIGQDFAAAYSSLKDDAQRERTMSLPWSSLEIYPNALACFDIALAPARNTGWYRAKSALRFYEAAALGIPTIGDPLVYGEINHGVDGFLVESDEDWRDYMELLVNDHDLRLRMGLAARARAWSEFDMNVRVKQWTTAIAEVAAG